MSTEYGLLVALIGSAVIVGVGVAVRPLFDEIVPCFIQQMQSSGTSAPCVATDSGDSGGAGDGAGADGAGPGAHMSPSPSSSPTPSKTPSTTPSPSVSPTPAASAGP